MLSAFTPRRLFLTAIGLELLCARALASTAGADADWLHWAEHGNRLHAFSLFQYADIAIGRAGHAEISDLVERTLVFNPYDRVWVTEGVGYLWRDRVRGELPESSLIPVHSGVGLAVASGVLQQPSARRRTNLVATLIDRCSGCAMPGFERVVMESVGLAVRNLHPRLAPQFDEALCASDAVLRACFWHGVGRGAYFATSNWRPASESGVVDLARLRGFVTDEAARINALAGFAWAATLVNLHTPEVLTRYLAALKEEEKAAFAHGVSSSLIVWQHCAPDDDGIAKLLASESRGGAESWDALVRRPAELAVRAYPALAAGGLLQDVFHCEAA